MLPIRHRALCVASRLVRWHELRDLRQTLQRHVSIQASAHVKRKQPLLLIYSVLSGTALAAAYLFWPNISRSAPAYSNAILSPAYFIPVTLTASEACSDPGTRLITLTVPPQSLPSREESTFNPVWSVYIKDDDIQVERPYTPLEGIDSDGHMKFWIKKYPKGEVGRWLHSKKVGDKIEIRGPLKTWPWEEGVWDEVVMISGGTGITPFYQLLHHTVLHGLKGNPKTRFTLLHSSHTPAELPPPDMIDPLLRAAQANPERFSMSLFVDSLDGPPHPSVGPSHIQAGRINKTAIERIVGLGAATWWHSLLHISHKERSRQESTKKILFLVCGPDPMITAVAGPLGRNFSQGAVGGVLGMMGYGSDQVWKL
ncbi:hypothetical protein AcW1_004337 [Taiwanofungus camphoratus]|nr:hypothetical protein AcW1_004337 [Antrodia cinnamomea]